MNAARAEVVDWRARLRRVPSFDLLAPFANAIVEADRATGFPSVVEIDRALGSTARMRFGEARPKRQAREALPAAARRLAYDETIEAGEVPTRPANLHDLMNALIWAAFPTSKRALHAIQLAHLRSSTDPTRRTEAHDTIAMLDEGGVLILGDEAGAHVVFGHAILEQMVESDRPAYALGVVCPRSGRTLGELDTELAGMLAEPGRFVSHRGFPRVRVGG